MSGDTVFGQGTNPKPEDETYLSLLKNTIKAKVKINLKDEEDEKETINIRMTKDHKSVHPL